MLAESIVPRMLKTMVIPLLGSGCDSDEAEGFNGSVVDEEAPSKFIASVLRRVALICKMLSRSAVKSAAALRAWSKPSVGALIAGGPFLVKRST